MLEILDGSWYKSLTALSLFRTRQTPFGKPENCLLIDMWRVAGWCLSVPCRREREMVVARYFFLFSGWRFSLGIEASFG